MIADISIYTGGVLTVCMALFHTRFFVLFKWAQAYEQISSVNRRIFYTIHLALLLLFFLIGFLTVVYARELGRCAGVALGFNGVLALFWLWRTVWQLLYFKGRGKRLHYLLILWFFVLCLSYGLPVMLRLIS
jgi:hypothetical protein